MSSKHLRTKLSALLKERNMGKIYTGKKQQALRLLPSHLLKQMIYLLSLSPGELVNDCDGFNHRVVGPVNYHHTRYGWRNGKTFNVCQVEFEDGRYSCGCPTSPESALSREQIEKYFCHDLTEEFIEKQRKLGWWGDTSQRMYDAIKSGGHICDENGIRLPEFERKYDEENDGEAETSTST